MFRASPQWPIFTRLHGTRLHPARTAGFVVHRSSAVVAHSGWKRDANFTSARLLRYFLELGCNAVPYAWGKSKTPEQQRGIIPNEVRNTIQGTPT